MFRQEIIAAPSAQPAGYAKRYSTRLLEKMAECIYGACNKAGFRRFADQQGQGDAFVSLNVSEAWKAFQQDAGAIPTFELSAIEKLKKQLLP